MINIRFLALSLFLLACSLSAGANTTSDTRGKEVKIEDLSWSDQNYLEKQVATIDEIARTQLGTQIRQKLSDLELLQRIVDRSLIPQTQVQEIGRASCRERAEHCV